MKLHDLQPAPGSTKRKKRLGRGIAAGQGKTAGRGTKGQGARTGNSRALYFEGGQLPLVRRLPFRRGFTNIWRVQYSEVNLERLGQFKDGAVVSPQSLFEAGIIKSSSKPVVILGQGDLDRKLTVKAHRFSASARAKIEAVGGAVEVLPLE
jgi:large subunit ribosomal protein L15